MSVKQRKRKAGFDLATRDSCFTILVEVFTNHISLENSDFINYIE